MVTSFKRSHAHTTSLSAPAPQQVTADPRLHQRLLDTHGASLAQSLVGSLLLSPGSWYIQAFVCALQGSVFQSCVSFGDSVVGLVATSSKRAYATPRSPAPRALSLQQATADPNLCRRHSDTVLAQSLSSLWVLVCAKFV